MEAGDWEELKFLLDSAGVPVDKAVGLGDNSQDDQGKTLVMCRGWEIKTVELYS